MKFFAGLNTWALLVAAVASFFFGGVWYGIFSKRWMQAAKLTPEAIKGTGGPSPTPFVISFVAELLMAWLLAGLLAHMVKAGLPANARNGMITAALIWAGFVATTLTVNHRYQMQSWALTLIDGGHWLGVLLLQGAILGIWGLA